MMMTTGHSRFMFEENFEVKTMENELQTIDLDEHHQLVDAAKQEAFDAGLQEGRSSSEALFRQEATAHAERIVAQVADLLENLQAERDEMLGEAIHLAKNIGLILAEKALEQYPTLDIETLLRDCLSSLRDTPHVVIRLNCEHADELRKTIDQMALEAGFEGKIVILAEENVDLHGCHIEWADGGAVRDTEQARADIEKRIGSFLEAKIKDASLTETLQHHSEDDASVDHEIGMEEAPQPPILEEQDETQTDAIAESTVSNEDISADENRSDHNHPELDVSDDVVVHETPMDKGIEQ